jgi:hypothetical protein
MINLVKNTANTVVFTLNELKRFPSAPNNFRFIHDDLDNTEKVFRMSDLSPYPVRYNKYTLSENSVENLSAGTVSLKTGWGTYEVYEDPNDTFTIYGNPIEIGRYYVSGYTGTFNSTNINDIYF